MSKYKMREVAPKNGEMRDIHHRLKNCKWCEITDLRKGGLAWFKYRPDRGSDRIAHTSIVEEIICLDDGGLEIHTQNTIYYLEELEENAD